MYCIEAQNTTAAPLQQHSKHAIGAHCVFTVCSPIWPHCVGVMLSFSHNQRWAVWFKNKTLVIVSATLSLVPAGTSSSWDLAGGKRRFSHTVGLDSTANRSFPLRDCTPISCCIYAINNALQHNTPRAIKYNNIIIQHLCSGKTQ